MKKPSSQVLHAFSLLRDPVLRDAFNRPPNPAEQEARELGDRIESYEDADPPAVPPPELVAAFNAAREKAHADSVARQGTPRINLLAVEPIGTEMRESAPATSKVRATLQTATIHSDSGSRLVAGVSPKLMRSTLEFTTEHGTARIDLPAPWPAGFAPPAAVPSARYEITIRRLRAAPKRARRDE